MTTLCLRQSSLISSPGAQTSLKNASYSLHECFSCSHACYKHCYHPLHPLGLPTINITVTAARYNCGTDTPFLGYCQLYCLLYYPNPQAFFNFPIGGVCHMSLQSAFCFSLSLSLPLSVSTYIYIYVHTHTNTKSSVGPSSTLQASRLRGYQRKAVAPAGTKPRLHHTRGLFISGSRICGNWSRFK